MYKILIVEDEEITLDISRNYLKKMGHDVKTAYNSKAAKELLEVFEPDCVVLDILLPDGSGLALCEHIKKKYDCPVIFVSALSEEEDRVKGFVSGGDDYMVKPFSPIELYYRINARIKHGLIKGKQLELMRFEDMEIDISRKECRVGGQKLELTKKEFEILLLLARQRERTFTLEDIYTAIWGIDDVKDTRTVQTHVSNLRESLSRRLEEKNTYPRFGEPAINSERKRSLIIKASFTLLICI